MELRYSADVVRYKRMTSSELRESYVVANLFTPDVVPFSYLQLLLFPDLLCMLSPCIFAEQKLKH